MIVCEFFFELDLKFWLFNPWFLIFSQIAYFQVFNESYSVILEKSNYSRGTISKDLLDFWFKEEMFPVICKDAVNWDYTSMGYW